MAARVRILTAGGGRASGRPAIDDPPDRTPRQLLLRHEASGGALGDPIREVCLRMGRYQDHHRPATIPLSGQAPGKVESALTAQPDVHQHDLRPQLFCSSHCLSGGSGAADHTQALSFQQNARSLKKQRVVIHNQDGERHTNSIPAK